MKRTLSIALDYSVIDHLQRIEAGSYAGAHKEALLRLRFSAEKRRVEVWGSEITFVEMVQGLENLVGREAKQNVAAAKDAAKRAIMETMGVRRLGYPCSRFDDDYSRLDISFRYAGPNWDEAKLLEDRLRKIAGVSEGDARQLVSCAYPFDGDDTSSVGPILDWFVTEDRPLVAAVNVEVSARAFPELAHLRFGSVADLVAANPSEFEPSPAGHDGASRLADGHDP